MDKQLRVRLGNKTDPHPELWEGSFDDFAQANCDDPDMVEEVDRLAVGEVCTGGGGAAPEFWVLRLS